MKSIALVVFEIHAFLWSENTCFPRGISRFLRRIFYTFFQPLMNNVWPISTIKWLLKQSTAFKTISQNLMNNWQQLFDSLHLFSSIWPSKTVCKCFNQFRSYYDNCDSFMNNYTELLNSFQNCSTVFKTIKQRVFFIFFNIFQHLETFEAFIQQF